MKFNRFDRLAVLVCLCAGFLARMTSAADKIRPEIKTERVLFLGNSITRHGVLEKIGWTTDWGMAASAQEKDYVHLVTAGIADMAGNKPEMKLQNIADFERSPASYDLEAKLKEQLAFKPTLVVVAIGENVPALTTDDQKAQFKTSYLKLLNMLKDNGRPTLIVRSSFWADKNKDDIMQQACVSVGGIYADLSALSKDESNYARSERKFQHDGVAAHPGDKGMKAIADAILKVLKQ